MIREIHLDTTYIMPFFHLDIDVEGFSRELYKEIIISIQKIHLSEISIIEAKAKSLKIGRGEKLSVINKRFNDGLAVLKSDSKVKIHSYIPEDDKKFNEILPLGLDFFDSIILAQSYKAGSLLTENMKLLRSNVGIEIINWKKLVEIYKKETI